jgi:hypothetical protein
MNTTTPTTPHLLIGSLFANSKRDVFSLMMVRCEPAPAPAS